MKLIVFVLLGAAICAISDFASARPYANDVPRTAASSHDLSDAFTGGYIDATGEHPPYDAHYTYPCEPYYFCPGIWNPHPDFDLAYEGAYWWGDHNWNRSRWNQGSWNDRPWDQTSWRNHDGRWRHWDRNPWRWHNSPVGPGRSLRP